MSLKAQQHVIRFAALCGRGPTLESLLHPPSFTPLLALSPYQSEEPKVQINSPSPSPSRWPTITNLTSSRGHISLSLSVSLCLSLIHFFPIFSHNLSLSFSEDRILCLQKLRLNFVCFFTCWREKTTIVWARMTQASRESYPSEWKIYDCLPLFQNITLTLSRSKRSSPPCLFSMKSLRFLKT